MAKKISIVLFGAQKACMTHRMNRQSSNKWKGKKCMLPNDAIMNKG
jgi:hypothetical protein